jgi:hypothetical protein
MQCKSPHRGSRKQPLLAAMVVAVGVLAGCGSSDNGVTVLPVGTAKIQGAMRGFDGLPALNSLTGLGAGLSVTLQNNGHDDVTLTSNASFAFPTELAPGTAYAVTVKAQPLGQTCTVDSGSGTIDAQGTSVANVAVNCIATSSIGGGVRGLNAGETVSIISGGVITQLGANGPFALPGTSAKGTQYAVSVFTQPATGVCTVINGSGTVAENVMGLIGIQCASTAPSVKGTLTGLGAGERVELQNNAGDTIALTSDQAFAFPSNVGAGGAYGVTVSKQPVTQTCTVANGAGAIDADGDVVSNVAVTCAVSASVGGKVDGLANGSTLLLANGSVTLPVSGSGMYAFPGLQTPGVSYNVTVQSQPAGQVCVVTGGTGVVFDGASVNVGVICLSIPTTSLTLPAPVAIGGSAQGQVSVTNTSSVPVTVAASTSGDFTTNQDCATIAAGATCGIPVTFTPSAPGVANGALTLVVNRATPIVVPLSGLGAPLPGALSFGTNSLGFMSTTVGQFSAEQQIVVTNIGGSSANIGTPTASAADFTLVTNTCPAVLAPADSCTLGVRFAPTVGGLLFASLDLPYDGNVASANLSGFGAPVVAVLSGTVTGLQETFAGYPTNSQFTLLINGMLLTISANGSFTYQNNILSPNGGYSVSVGSQPSGAAGQSCTVSNGSGMFTGGVQSAPLVVTCTTPAQKKIVGTVAGLAGGTVQLSAQFTSLAVSANGTFTLLPTPGSYTMYSVTITVQPAGQTCTVSNGAGNFDPTTGLGDTAPSVICTP